MAATAHTVMTIGVVGHRLAGACVVHPGVLDGHIVLRVRRRGGLGAIGMGRGHANARHRKGGDRERQHGDENGA